MTVFGVEHIRLAEYRKLLERYRHDNEEALASVLEDLDAGDVDQVPVNWCVIAVKEADGRLRVFLEAKSHPFVGEENLDVVPRPVPGQDLSGSSAATRPASTS